MVKCSNSKHFGAGTLKALSLAALVGMITLGGAANATTIDEVDLSQIPLNKPTLDYLHENNITYSKDTDGDGIGDTDVVYPQSGYTLTGVDDKTLPNVITKYTFDSSTNNLTESYYQVGLKQTEYGTKEGATDVKYFNWGKDADGNTTLTQGTSVLKANDITYYINESVSPLATERVITDQNGADINNSFHNFRNGYSRIAVEPNYANRGGAICNEWTIGDITGDFIGNYVLGIDGRGGAIYNFGTIGNITGDFIGNSAKPLSYNSYGGAICNYAYPSLTARIGNITGDFIGNYVEYGGGGAICNYAYSSSTAQIGNITGDFIGNYVEEYGGGGAIYNYAGYSSSTAQIGNITGDFIGNYALSTSASASGGAIYNYAYYSSLTAQIGDITGDFVGNYAQSSSAVYGGVIYNSGTIGDIISNFIGNYAKSVSYDAQGGAIYNSQGLIGDIAGNFVNNYAQITSFIGYNLVEANGGAIYNSGTIGDITGHFIGNYTSFSYSSDCAHARGGAIYNYYKKIGNITSNFIGNYAFSSSLVSANSPSYYSSESTGGAIQNDNGTIENITGDFINNRAITSFKVADSTSSGEHTSYAGGGAIYNAGNIDTIASNFFGNFAQGKNANGGAIINAPIFGNSYIGVINGSFIKNYVKSETGTAQGGAIYNVGKATIGQKDGAGNVVGGIINSSFIDNYAKSETGTAQGGAIWTSSDLNIIAKDNYTSVFEGNYTESNGIKDDNAIYVDKATLNFEMQNGGSFLFRDNIRAVSVSPKSFYAANGVANLNEYAKTQGFKDSNVETFLSQFGYSSTAEMATAWGYESEEALLNDYGNESFEEMAIAWGYPAGTAGEQFLLSSRYNSEEEFLKSQGVGESYINIKGDDINNTTFYLLNDIHNANVTFANTTINTINNNVHTYNFNQLTLNADTNFVADVDLEAQTMDRFTADSYGQHAGNLNVVGMNLLTDAPEDREVTEIYFAQQGLKDNVAYGGAELPHDNYQTTFYTPIYKYNAIYDNRDDAGYFVFTKANNTFVPTPDSGTNGGGTSTPIVTPSGNPSDAFNPAVLGSSTSATVGALGTMNTTMHYAFQNAENFMHIPYLERIAHRDRNKYALSPTGDATDVGTFSPLFNKGDYGSAWVKPYATFENVALKNGPKVSNITYGTLIGFDTDIESIKKGWDRTFTGYIAYNGASQRYSGVDSYQNGGLIGGTMTLYKGNFFNATTVSVGANVASNSTMYGHDNYTMLLGGIGNKAGYNFEIKEGKLIFQPSMLVSYTWVNTFDYTNAAGVKIENDPLHAIQLAPGVKLIGNTKNGWQPYIGVNMVWNLMGKSDATANGVRLPAMSIKPYVQYGVGVQKRFKDHFMGFGQVMVHSGGRNGVSINGGFRWALGHDCNCQKVEGKGLFKFARKNKEVEPQPYDMMYRGNKQFGLYNRKVIKQLASVERTKAMK